MRPLLYDEHLGAFVMERLSTPTLRQLLESSRDGPRAVAAVAHAGRWLRAFAASYTAPLETMRATADELRAKVVEYDAFLARQPHARDLAAATEGIFRGLDGPFPMGVYHGDFAPRNIFVDVDATVTVIDFSARLRLPLHEDVAYLLLELRLGGTPLRRGRNDPAFRTALVAGADIEDDRTLAAFEGLVLLDKWAAAVAGPRSLRHRLRLRRIEQLGRESARRLVAWAGRGR